MKRFMLAMALISTASLSTPALAGACTDLGRGMSICRDDRGNVMPAKNAVGGSATTGGYATNNGFARNGGPTQGAGVNAGPAQ
jgi:hypothetical protein